MYFLLQLRGQNYMFSLEKLIHDFKQLKKCIKTLAG
jgi:hypothetical protein